MKNKSVPNWIIKIFKEGKEDERLCYLVDIFFFSLVGIVWGIKLFANLIPFTYLIISTLIILSLLLWFSHWLFCKVELLKALREQAREIHKNKTEKEMEASVSKPKKLRV